MVGEQLKVPVYMEEGNQNPVEIARHAVEKAKNEGFTTVIIDTAGRLAVDEVLMQEITNIKEAVQPYRDPIRGGLHDWS